MFYNYHLYIELRISNPKINREALVTKSISMIKNDFPSFTSFIREYAIMIYKIEDEVYNYFLDKEVPLNEQDELITNIIKKHI